MCKPSKCHAEVEFEVEALLFAGYRQSMIDQKEIKAKKARIKDLKSEKVGCNSHTFVLVLAHVDSDRRIGAENY